MIEEEKKWFNASIGNDIKAIKRAIEEGIDVNITTYPNGWAALHYACYYGRIEMAKLLIDSGADINIQNKHFRTPMHYACIAGSEPIIKFIINCGVKIAMKDDMDETPFSLLKNSYPKQYEELMKWLSEEYPEKALEIMASESVLQEPTLG